MDRASGRQSHSWREFLYMYLVATVTMRAVSIRRARLEAEIFTVTHDVHGKFLLGSYVGSVAHPGLQQPPHHCKRLVGTGIDVPVSGGKWQVSRVGEGGYMMEHIRTVARIMPSGG